MRSRLPVLVSVAAGLVHAVIAVHWPLVLSGLGSSAHASQPVDGSKTAGGLTAQAAEMREAILTAARSGDIEALGIPIQWNELSPDFAATALDDPIAHFKALSGDGEGREILAALAEILELPFATVRLGRDIENNRIFVWPYLAERDPRTLSPAETVDLLRLAPPAALAQMRADGRYRGWRLSIGSDGTWHSFRRVD